MTLASRKKTAEAFFSRQLMNWNRRQNLRRLPWKGEKDPYRIWLSEIILQQTRVDQGLPYYERFLDYYPSLDKLAGASDVEVFRLWQGLGYYKRCQNLMATAREIAAGGGRFPHTYEELKKLRGVGPYTAAAIASFAFGLPYAVVDGNVIRVLSRFFALSQTPTTARGKKSITDLAARLLDTGDPGAYNQAIMDFGAMVCMPQKPACADCCLAGNCQALRAGRVRDFPVRLAKPALRKRYFHYLLLRFRGGLYIRQRSGNDIWPQLYELPLIELESVNPADLLGNRLLKGWLAGVPHRFDGMTKVYTQRLSHQHISARFYQFRLGEALRSPDAGFRIPMRDWPLRAFPRLIVSLLQEKKLTLFNLAPEGSNGPDFKQ